MPILLETQVNTYVTGTQNDQQVTTLSDGGWVITWESTDQDGSNSGVYAQAYNADGTTRGVETQVNTYTTSDQYETTIAALNDGGWVITWLSNGQDGDLFGVYAQAYNADGTAQGVETQVNTYTTNFQTLPQITALNDGGWVITWQSRGQDGSGNDYGIYAQAYNADGTAQGVETQVNTYTTNFQDNAQITALNDGGWVITWQSYTQDGDEYGIYAQAYNADGTVQGVETQVNTYTTDSQTLPQITALIDGGWVIMWQSRDQDGNLFGIYAQAYNADGTAQGSEVQVNTYTTNRQDNAQITALNDGGWVITWQSLGQDGDNYGIYSQAYNADGTAQGVETQVNTYTTSSQDEPQITALIDGGWVITWTSNGQDGNSGGIYAQAYNADGTTRFDELHVNSYVIGNQDSPEITALPNGGWLITWASIGQDGDNAGVFSRAYIPLDTDAVTVALTGTQEVGEVLTATVVGADVTLDSLNATYTWTVGSTIVATTLKPTFTLLPEHANQVVSVNVVLVDTFFELLVTKGAATDPIFDGNDAPLGDITFTEGPGMAIIAPVEDGDIINGDAAGLTDVDGMTTASLSYQWLRGGEEIAGATSSSYVIATADEGYKLKLAVSYTDDAGFENVALSSALKVAGVTGEVFVGDTDDNQITGTNLNDIQNGLAGADVLLGLKGRDVLVGGNGSDTIIGGRGADTLKGGGGADTLIGGAGQDKLKGGVGDDLMTGGDGADVFVFNGTFGDDVVTDFETGVDSLEFDGFSSIGFTQVDADVLITIDIVNTITFLDTDTSDFNFLLP